MYIDKPEDKTVCRFLLLYPGDENFRREFELLGNHTLLDFHKAIQKELEYEPEHMASFYTASATWVKEQEYTLIRMDKDDNHPLLTMEEGVLAEIINSDKKKLLYTFDYFTDRSFFIELKGTTNYIEGREYPSCNRSGGFPPPQSTLNDELSQEGRENKDTEE